MKMGLLSLALAAGLCVLGGGAHACGFGEAPDGCGDTGENEAKYMLQRVVSAIKADKPAALKKFAHGEDGFRTVNTYVFCVGPDGTMTAHPNAALQDQNVSDLHDRNGNYFIKEMMASAKPGAISEIRYLFPRPGGTEAVPKTTYYTRADDQVCGVGIYDDDAAQDTVVSPDTRAAQLRQRLSAAMPSNLGPDWSAFLQALDQSQQAHEAALDTARKQIHAAEMALSTADAK